MQQRPVLLLIDVEPNTPYDRAADRWTGTQVAFQEFERLRRIWEDATGHRVVLNWFLRCDPQIREVWGRRDYIHTAFPDFTACLRDGQDYAGINPHFWRWDMRWRRWFNDFSDRRWKEHCLLTSIIGFQEMLGYRPRASRFGSRWMDQQVMELLVREGIRYDLTLEPGEPQKAHWSDGFATEFLPETRYLPRHMYQPRINDYRRPRAEGAAGPDLWIIPSSKAPATWGQIWRFPPLMRFERTCNLALWPQVVQTYLDGALHCPDDHPLVLTLRSGDLSKPEHLANFLATTERINAHPGLQNLRFVAVPDALPRRAEPVDGAGTGASEDLTLRRDTDHMMRV